jgi:hypothetical protein
MVGTWAREKVSPLLSIIHGGKSEKVSIIIVDLGLK